jgi:hypothetical protein
MRDIDIISDIELRELQISKLQEEISALKKVAEIYGLNGNSDKPNDVPKKKGFGESKFAMSVGDASAKVLENEKDGLHLDKILEKISELGVTPTRTSLDSALRNDGKKMRFKLLGKRIWTLVEN